MKTDLPLVCDGNVDPHGRRIVESLLEEKTLSSAVYYQSTPSTNASALAELPRLHSEATQRLPRLYLADEQTAGRGRHGRTWQSNDSTLTFSIVVGRSQNVVASNLLSIATGVAIAEAIEYCCAPLRCQLKWPNDVYLAQGKLAGILIETNHATPDYAVIGIGINVNKSPNLGTAEDIDSASHVSPSSLTEVTGKSIIRYDLLYDVVQRLLQLIDPKNSESTEILQGFRDRCALTGETVSYVQQGTRSMGQCLGITETGELSIESSSGQTVTCNSGEVERVRIQNE